MLFSMTSSILLIVSSFIGYILVFLTLKSSKYNRILNSFLLFIFFVASTSLMLAGIGEIYNNADLKAYYAITYRYITLLLPCFYLYFNYLIKNQNQFFFKDFMHIIFLFLATIERDFLILDKIFGYKLNYHFSQFFVFYATVYLILIFQMLKKNVWNKKSTLSLIRSQNEIIKKWTVLLFIIIIIFVSRFYIVWFKQYLFSETLAQGHHLKYIWLPSLVWLVLYIIILFHPEILYGYAKYYAEPAKTKPNSYDNNYWNLKSKVKINNNNDLLLKEKISSKIETYIFELNVLLYNNSYFVNPGFSLKDLAKVLNVPKSHLNYIFKYHSELSFSDYKKISRIQNSIELINNNYLSVNTFDSLSKKVGFSSYNPFFCCFKEVVGKSPHEYISSIKSN
jgi:AraC-like DNA-binding protein